MTRLSGKPRHNPRAVALGLPPDTPDNVVQGYFFRMRAHNRIVQVKREFEQGPPAEIIAPAKEATDPQE